MDILSSKMVNNNTCMELIAFYLYLKSLLLALINFNYCSCTVVVGFGFIILPVVERAWTGVT